MNKVIMVQTGTLYALTVRSIARVVPDARVIELDADDWTPSALAVYLQALGMREPAFVLRAGMIVQRDPWDCIPQGLDLGQYQWGTCCRLMYVAPGAHHPDYKTIGVDPADNDCDRMLFVTPLETNGRTMRMPTQMRYGPDPIVHHINEAFRQTEFYQDALKACVLDFGDQAMDPGMTAGECFAYPFDVYAKAADEVSDYLPAHAVATIKANAARGAVSYATAPALIRSRS